MDNEFAILQTMDGKRLMVPYEAAQYSEYLREILLDNEENEIIPIYNIPMPILVMVMEFCDHHKKDKDYKRLQQPLDSNDINQLVPKWDAAFIKNYSLETCFQLIQAANYLAINSLIDLGCAWMTCHIKDRTPEFIRKTFNIENDFTEEEEAQLNEELNFLKIA